jgi:hypothetical protein
MWMGPLRDEWKNRGCFLKARTMRVYERIDNNNPGPYYFLCAKGLKKGVMTAMRKKW